MNYLNGSILLLIGVFIGIFSKKLFHKLAVFIRNQKEKDFGKKDDDLKTEKDDENEDDEEIDFEEEDLKMVFLFDKS